MQGPAFPAPSEKVEFPLKNKRVTKQRRLGTTQLLACFFGQTACIHHSLGPARSEMGICGQTRQGNRITTSWLPPPTRTVTKDCAGQIHCMTLFSLQIGTGPTQSLVADPRFSCISIAERAIQQRAVLHCDVTICMGWPSVFRLARQLLCPRHLGRSLKALEIVQFVRFKP